MVGSVALAPEGDGVFGFRRAEPPWDPPGEHEDIYANETDDYAIGAAWTHAEEILAAEPRRSEEREMDIETTAAVGFVRAELLPTIDTTLYFEQRRKA